MPKGTSGGTRREESRKKLKRAVGLLVQSLDSFITEGSGNDKLRRKLEAFRPALARRCLKYDEVMDKIEDDELAILTQTESGALICLAFAVGGMLGSRKMAQHNMSRIRNDFKEKTSSGRLAALERRLPIKQKKKDITIETAVSYLKNHMNEKPTTPNALMVQIRVDIEKRCKFDGIKAPRPSSISKYLKEEKLL
jgi:hypothetical protein